MDELKPTNTELSQLRYAREHGDGNTWKAIAIIAIITEVSDLESVLENFA
jgi:hypothetical protein